MSDQCTNCQYRGVIDLCLSVECNHHESWYAGHLQAQLAERDKEIERAYSVLGLLGVTKKRAANLSSGIDILANRMGKEIFDQSRTILEQQALIYLLISDVEKWKITATDNIKENVDLRFDVDSLKKQIADLDRRIEELILLGGRFKADQKLLEAALKAERIKTLEEVALKDANDGRYGYAESELRRMANELNEQS